MQLYLDKPKTMVMKNGRTSLSFNVIAVDEFGTPGLILSGFRVMDGYIYPPMFKTRSGYYPNVYLSNEQATELYHKLKNSGWFEEYGIKALHDKPEAATAYAVYTDHELRRVAPTAIGVAE